MRSSDSSSTSYEDIKNRLQQRLEYVSKDIPMMMREVAGSMTVKKPNWILRQRHDVDVVVVGT